MLERGKYRVSIMVKAAELSLLSTFADSRASQEVVQAPSSSWEPLYRGCWHLPRRRHYAKKHRKKTGKVKRLNILWNLTELSCPKSFWHFEGPGTVLPLEGRLRLWPWCRIPGKPRIVTVTVSVCSSFYFFRFVQMHCFYRIELQTLLQRKQMQRHSLLSH